MTWTNELKIEALLRLPWTILAEAGDAPGERIVRVRELPDVIVVGSDETEIATEFWESLRASVTCYVEEGADPPLPEALAGRRLAWQTSQQPPARNVVMVGILPSAKTEETGGVQREEFAVAAA